MSQKTTGKASELRQTEFQFERPAYRTMCAEKRLNELLAIRGVYRGSDARFVAGRQDVNTTTQRKVR